MSELSNAEAVRVIERLENDLREADLDVVRPGKRLAADERNLRVDLRKQARERLERAKDHIDPEWRDRETRLYREVRAEEDAILERMGL